MVSPYTDRACVGYRAMESWRRGVGQNDVENDVKYHSRGLPIRVADGTGAVMVSEDLAQRRLSRRRDALLGQESEFDRTVKDDAAAGACVAHLPALTSHCMRPSTASMFLPPVPAIERMPP
jgi:hypothetical protein